MFDGFKRGIVSVDGIDISYVAKLFDIPAEWRKRCTNLAEASVSSDSDPSLDPVRRGSREGG